ncbi:hypothetical protein [Nitrosopumilus sp. Nsub]|uniref:hypothetical protein n=1 Tax=Nitrosopumilus sp. Nsub TaxID=1776294 RepID=UPI000832EF97|nr:hypothetical protein [Nitrosopumilus sp. Nsub]
MSSEYVSNSKDTIKVGITVGLVACVALFASLMSIDQQLGLQNGVFFKTLEHAFGVDPVLAIFIGFCGAAIIGIIYNLVSDKWRTFRIITPTKGILTGAVTGAIVFGLVFVPLHTGVLIPAVEANIFSSEPDDFLSEEISALKHVLINNTHVLWYGAFMHVIFGSILGLMSGFVVSERYRTVKRIRSFW